MMRNTLLAAAALLVAATGAQAQSCPSGTSRVTTIDTVVVGKTMCAATSNERWQEFHANGGGLVDYKKGPSDSVDPSETVGSYTYTNGANAVLTHIYGASSYGWLVCQAAAGYTLVSTGSSGTIPNVTLQSGQGPCP